MKSTLMEPYVLHTASLYVRGVERRVLMYRLILLGANELFAENFRKSPRVQELNIKTVVYESAKKLYVDRYLKKDELDILLVDESAFEIDMMDLGFQEIILMTENMDHSIGYGKSVHKYASLKEYVSVIEHIIERRDKTKVIAFYSPGGGVGKSALSLLFSKLLVNEGKSVLYICSEWDLANVLYEGVQMGDITSQMLIDDMMEDYDSILERFSLESNEDQYDYIVVNCEGLSVKKTNRFFGKCEYIHLVSADESTAPDKIHQLMVSETSNWLQLSLDKTMLLKNLSKEAQIVQSDEEHQFKDIYTLAKDDVFTDHEGKLNLNSTVANVLLLMIFNYYL